MRDFLRSAFTRQNIFNAFWIIFIISVIPVGLYLVQKTQIFKSRATVTDSVAFMGGGYVTGSNGQYVSTQLNNIRVKLTSPISQPTPAPLPVAETPFSDHFASADPAGGDLSQIYYYQWDVMTGTSPPDQPAPAPNHPFVRMVGTLTNRWDLLCGPLDNPPVACPATREKIDEVFNAERPKIENLLSRNINKGGVWIIGNEANWMAKIEPALYAYQYDKYYQLIKNLDPAAKIAVSGLTYPYGQDDPYYPTNYFDSFLANLPRSEWPDIYNVHYYPLDGNNDTAYNKVLDQAREMKEYVTGKDPGKLIWVTEYGVPQPEASTNDALKFMYFLTSAFIKENLADRWFWFIGGYTADFPATGLVRGGQLTDVGKLYNCMARKVKSPTYDCGPLPQIPGQSNPPDFSWIPGAPTPTPTSPPPIPTPTSVATPAPTSPPQNLLPPAIQNWTIKNEPSQKAEWVNGPGTFTLSGTVEYTPVQGGGWPNLAQIGADVYEGNRYLKSYNNNSSFTLSQGQRVAVILRAVNADARFTNVSLSGATVSSNLLPADMQNATVLYNPDPGLRQKVQWFTGNEAAGTFNLTGNISGDGIIFADEYSGPEHNESTFVGSRFAGTSFTIPAGNEFALILRTKSGPSASYSNVSLTKNVSTSNLLPSAIQNWTVKNEPSQKAEWVNGPGTFTLSGTVEYTPVQGGGWPNLAQIGADVYEGNRYLKSYNNNSSFTLSQGQRVAVILRAVNADARFTNVSLTRGEVQGTAKAAERPYTTHFKVAKSPGELNNAPLQDYDTEPKYIDFTFSNTAPGTQETLFVKFIVKEGNSIVREETRQAVITYQQVATPTPTSTPAPPPGASNALKTVVILTRLQDSPPQPVLDKNQIKRIYFDWLNDFFRDVSYDKISIETDVYGWYTLPLTSRNLPANPEVVAINAADADIDFSKYSRLIIVGPWGGADNSTIIPSPYRTNDGMVSLYKVMLSSQLSSQDQTLQSIYRRTVAHEFAHTLGFKHDGFLKCRNQIFAPAGCDILPYGNSFDVLGRGQGHLAAPFKERLDWITADRIRTVTGAGTYEIIPYEREGNGSMALKIPRGDGSNLYIEYRQPIGVDAGFPHATGRTTNVYEGVLIYLYPVPYPYNIRWTDGQEMNRPEVLLLNAGDLNDLDFYHPALTVGNSFTDPLSNTTITVVSKTPERLTVRVTPAPSTITNAGVNTDWDPWAVWVIASNLNSSTVAQVFDQGNRWGSDIPLVLGSSGDGTFNLPSNSPASGCNRNGSCEITIKLLDTATGALSNEFPVTIPQAPSQSPIDMIGKIIDPIGGLIFPAPTPSPVRELPVCKASDAGSFKDCIDKVNSNQADKIEVNGTITCRGADACNFSLTNINRPVSVYGTGESGFRRTDFWGYSILNITDSKGAVEIKNLKFDDNEKVAACQTSNPSDRATYCSSTINIYNTIDLTLDNLTILYPKYMGVSASRSENLTIKNSSFIGGVLIGIWMPNDAENINRHVRIENNLFRDIDTGAAILAALGDKDRWNTFKNNTLIHNHKKAYWFTCGPGKNEPCSGGQLFVDHSYYSLIEGNTIRDGVDDIYPNLDPSGIEFNEYLGNIRVIKNQIYNNKGSGIVNNPGSGNIDFSSIVIAQNNIFNNLLNKDAGIYKNWNIYFPGAMISDNCTENCQTDSIPPSGPIEKIIDVIVQPVQDLIDRIMPAPSSAPAPSISNAGVNTSYTPWAVWVTASNINYDTRVKLFDQGKEWESGILLVLADDRKGGSFVLPSNTPPSGCNQKTSCEIKFQIFDKNTEALSNQFPLTLPVNAVSQEVIQSPVVQSTPLPTPQPTPAGSIQTIVKTVTKPLENIIPNIPFLSNLIVTPEITPLPSVAPQIAVAQTDFNGDSKTNAIDLSILFSNWGKELKNSKSDINGDSVVNSVDYTLFLKNYKR